ncbi:MAG: ATP-binding protein [Blastocatellia bacterium]|nr:ATP-binding protein [Blastocatellia bacterium]
MATTLTTGDRFAQDETTAHDRWRASLWSLSGVRARQIALITLLVALVVVVSTLANIANLTGVIISRTRDQADQLSSQIEYAVKQEMQHNLSVAELNSPYAALAAHHSSVRGLMESTIISSRPIAYLYITNVSGRIITDAEGRNELAANAHMIGAVPSNNPDLNALANQNAYLQLYRVFSGPALYEFRKPISVDNAIGERVFEGELHIGVLASAVRSELVSPIATNLFIGLLAIVIAAIVAISSANLLLKPLEAISAGIDRLGEAEEPDVISDEHLPRDEAVTGVTARLRQLGERLAGRRTELELMRGQLRQIVSHLEDRLLLINREGRIILASPDAERILGIERLDITGLPIDESLGANHPLVILVERAFSEHRSIARTILHVPDGARAKKVLASLQYIEDAGEAVGALVSLRDYESFQKFESQWDLSKKLADLGRITSGIAHEVKNPLNAMVIHLEILRSKLESGTADPKPQIEILDSEIKRLDRVVQTFLNFTRPVEVSLQPLDLNTIVRQVVALASTEAEERGVMIKQELAYGQLIVDGDADILKQGLLNVIINGCQAMPEGGPLKVSTSRVADGSVRITVSDRGIGIAPEARERIFNLYYTTRKGGSGIGLAQAFRSIQLHNGKIRFESEVGVGTTFEIILPASD